MATQLEIVNDLQERLREKTTASVSTTDYSKLLGMFVNDAIADMENINHEWGVYITEIDDTILADGTRTYDITETTDRSYLMRDFQFEELPAAYDVTSEEVGQLFDCAYKELLRERNLTNNPQDVAQPKVFSVKSDADGRGYSIELLWGANEARSWRMYWYVPQGRLARDGTDDSTEVQLPRDPVFYRALYYATNERGEEMGEPGGILWKQSVDAIAGALERDNQINKISEQIGFVNRECL